MNDKKNYCSFCEKAIPEGTQYWSLTMSHDEREGNTITVNQCQTWVEWCEQCDVELNCRSYMTIGSTEFQVVDGGIVKIEGTCEPFDPAELPF